MIINAEEEIDSYSYDGTAWQQEEIENITPTTKKITTTQFSYLAITIPQQQATEEMQEVNETVQEELQVEEKHIFNIDKKKLLWWFAVIALLLILG